MSLTLTGLEDLSSQINMYASSCPANQQMLQLSRAVKEFFIRTCLWTDKQTITVLDGVYDYDLAFSDNVFISDIASVMYEDIDYLPKVTLLDDNTIRLDEELVLRLVGKDLKIETVLAPNSFPCDIPSRLVTRYAEFLIAGALVNISGIPNKSYTNPNLEAKMGQKWQFGLTRASSDGATGNKKQIVGFTG